MHSERMRIAGVYVVAVNDWLESNRHREVTFHELESAFPDIAGMGRPALIAVLERLVLMNEHVEQIRSLLQNGPQVTETKNLVDQTVQVYERLAKRSFIVPARRKGRGIMKSPQGGA
jgi:hypothetical protein